MPELITRKILSRLRFPKPHSHKRDNGTLLIISGNDEYFGALLYATKAASRVVDLVYLLTNRQNQRVIQKLKLRTASFMPLQKFPERKLLDRIDCVLIGPGLGRSAPTKALVSQVLGANKKAVLDADALTMLDQRLMDKLRQRHILTPHHREFQKLFSLSPTPANAAAMAKRYGCYIVLKGPVDVVAEPSGKLSVNKTGNAGMTKGGTGDVLAGLIAALFTTNDAAASAAAGVYVNGAAGDDLFRRVGTLYDAEDLVGQLPHTFFRLMKNNK